MRRRATRLCLVRAADPDPGAAGRGVRSVRCRQARHRFTRAAGRAHTTLGAVAGGRALRLAYADPPYPGKARLYREHHDYAGEVNHAALIDRLAGYDGWALSTSAAALPVVLALCPPGVAVAAWHRGERPTTSRRPLNGWEPVIYHRGRDLPTTTGAGRRVDSLVHGVTAMTTPAHPRHRRQPRHVLPLDVHPARRPTRRPPRRPVPRLRRRHPSLDHLHRTAALAQGPARRLTEHDTPPRPPHDRSPPMTTDDNPQLPDTAHLEGLTPTVPARIAGWLTCAERGWHLFPVRPGDKRPAIREWQHRASTDPNRLLGFFTVHPRFNAGIACGPSGLHVVDCDMPKPGSATGGYDSGAQILADLATPHGGLPDTYTVATPSGGEHHYFTAPVGPTLGNTAKLLGPLLDTRGNGGYVLAPGCWLAPQPATRNRPGRPGGSYELIDDTNPVELPTWLHQALTETRPTASTGPAQRPCAPLRAPGRYLSAVLRDELERIHHAGPGEHNTAVFTAARALGQLAAGGALDPATAEELLGRAAARVAAGPCDCTTRGLAATIRSGLAYGARRPRHLPDVEQPHHQRKASA
ncbi:MAG: bifunctional DNA primase/polymerase [Pseudonocardia sp.]